MEGHFESQTQAPLYLFGLPNMDDARVDYALAIPGLGSLILKHDVNAEVTGLDAFPRDEWPNVPIVFWAFRIMVGIGMLMVLAGLWSGLQRLRGRLYEGRTLQRFALFMAPLGFVAVVSGWVVTEVGRQPWVIYGLLRTADAASPIAKEGVAGSLLAFIVVYFLVFGAGTFYIIRKMAGNADAIEVKKISRKNPGLASERLVGEED